MGDNAGTGGSRQGWYPCGDQYIPYEGSAICLFSCSHFRQGGTSPWRAVDMGSGLDPFLGLAGGEESAGWREGCPQGASWSGPVERII